MRCTALTLALSVPVIALSACAEPIGPAAATSSSEPFFTTDPEYFASPPVYTTAPTYLAMAPFYGPGFGYFITPTRVVRPAYCPHTADPATLEAVLITASRHPR